MQKASSKIWLLVTLVFLLGLVYWYDQDLKPSGKSLPSYLQQRLESWKGFIIRTKSDLSPKEQGIREEERRGTISNNKVLIPADQADKEVQERGVEKDKVELYRQEMIQKLANNFGDIVRSKFELSANWSFQRFWFVETDAVYVEYTDSGEFRRVLLVFNDQGLPLATGYFVPGENGWVLTQGEDRVFKSQRWFLYEFDPRTAQWERQN